MEFVWFAIGAFIGSLITNIIYLSKRTSGVLKIDLRDPEKDKYRFVINDITNVHKKKRIELKIDPNADLSQE